MAETYSLQEDLDDVRQQLKDIQTAIVARTLTLKESIPLSAPLLVKEQSLKDEIKALNPVATTAPPGKSISFPQVLPHSSIGFPVTFPSAFCSPPPPFTLQLK